MAQDCDSLLEKLSGIHARLFHVNALGKVSDLFPSDTLTEV